MEGSANTRSGPKVLFWGFYLIEVVEIIETFA